MGLVHIFINRRVLVCVTPIHLNFKSRAWNCSIRSFRSRRKVDTTTLSISSYLTRPVHDCSIAHSVACPDSLVRKVYRLGMQHTAVIRITQRFAGWCIYLGLYVHF